MSGEGPSYISIAMYRYLCQTIVGTEESVTTKRMLNAAKDHLSKDPRYVPITSGSFGEGLEMKGSDYDFMYVMTGSEVYEDPSDVPLRTTDTCLQTVTENVKPGFVKLLLIHNKDNSYFNSLFERIGSDLFLSNIRFKRAFSILSDIRQLLGSEAIHGPCVSDRDENIDLAGCLRSKYWTSQANRWITRSNQDWPSTELKRNILEHGVIFVPIGVKESPYEDIEWRISFSVAEKLLVTSFSHTQLLCYALMKILLKDVINKDKRVEGLLCSYFLKNILFWLSEELPLTLWRPENLISCFLRCLRRLIYCVTYTSCIHYFITENNMFENKMEGEKHKILLSNLNVLLNMDWQCLLLSPQLTNFRFQNNMLINKHCLFVDRVEQISKQSLCLEDFPIHVDIKHVFFTILSYKSLKIKYIYLRQYSKFCGYTAQIIPVTKTNRNKLLYHRYKCCQFFLLQSAYHDSIYSWLLLGSLFYNIKQYNKALNIFSYSVTKISQNELFKASAAAHTRRELFKFESIKRMGAIRCLNIFSVADVFFFRNSFLIPKELEPEVALTAHFLPPIVYAHFLSFLCYYNLGDVPRYTESLHNLNQTILKSYYIRNIHAKAAAYNCLGVAYQITGDMTRAKKAFTSAKVINSVFNCSPLRLNILGIS